MFGKYKPVATSDDSVSLGPATPAHPVVARPDNELLEWAPSPPATHTFNWHPATGTHRVPPLRPAYPSPIPPQGTQIPGRHAHFERSSTVIQSLHDQWDEFIHPNGSLYWTNSTHTVRVVSDIKPPLSKIQPSTSATIARLMHALVEIPQISDYQNWEIYTDGRSCVYIDHGSRAASDTAQSLEEFKDQIIRLRGEMNIITKLKFEAAYWTFMQSHPNHRDLPEGALDDATEALVWCHAGEGFGGNRVLFKASNAPFSKEDAQEMTDLIKTISDLKRPTLKTWYCAAVMRAISIVSWSLNLAQDRLASHYGQNDAREVRRKERADDVSSPLPFSSNWDRLLWHLVAPMSLGSSFGYLKRINNVDRTTTGDGVNTLRWRVFLKSLCKEWTDITAIFQKACTRRFGAEN
ncbi:hypothetical protein BDV93DRAFT_573665 [Ceratobasidium sp. AG-I]|nr:hypothetical protein BDV93DRAFT_573665 [Ceratobasidium sp. AG-I]